MRFLTLSLAAALAATGLSQVRIYTPAGSGGYGYGSVYNSQFNPKSLISFSGRVSGIQVGAPVSGLGDLYTILVKSANGGTSMVEVGPAWFVQNQGTQLKTGDWITVTGSKFIREGRGIIYASEIRRAGKILALRDHYGAPYWAVSRAIPAPAEIAVTPAEESPAVAPPIIVEPDPVLSTTSTRTLSTFNGAIARFVEWTPAGTTTPYLVAMLEASQMEVPIVLGPRWFIERQDVVFRVGDLMLVDTIKPPRSDMNHARRITINNHVLILRSGDGTPTWLAWRSP